MSRRVSDAISLIRDRLTKAEAKVSKHEKALESARSEVTDLQTALRVMADITGESVSAGKGGSASIGARQMTILQSLGTGMERSKPPADIFVEYKMSDGDDISADTFRTTIWRMKNKTFAVNDEAFVVRAQEGMYWKDLVRLFGDKKASGAETPEANDFMGLADGSQGGATHLHPEGSIPSSSTSVQASDFDPDLDDDVPF